MEQPKNLKRIKEIVAECDHMSVCAQILLKEGLVATMSQGRRVYAQIKSFDNKSTL